MMAEDVEKREAALHQARHLMQAGISASLADNVEEALKFFASAARRFDELQNQTNAGIARGWLEGLRDRERQRALTTAHL